MKKVLQNPIVIVLLLFIFLGIGVLIGRNSTTTVLKLVENTDPVEPDANQSEETIQEDYMVGDKVNINVAPAEVFESFPGIGDVLAERIITYREANGPFQSVDDLLNVEGIGETKLNAIRKYLTAE